MKITKRIFITMLILTLILAPIPASVVTKAQTTDTITVLLRVEDANQTLIPSTSVTLTPEDVSAINETYQLTTSGFTAAHALAKHISQDSLDLASDLTFAWGSPSHIVGEEALEYAPSWSFRVNDTTPINPDTNYSYNTSECPIKNGDTIVFFRQGCYDANAGSWGAFTSYSWFDKTRYHANTGTPFSITYQKDDGFATATTPVCSEPIEIYDTQGTFIQSVTTDTSGIANITMEKPGNYIITAGKHASNGIPENAKAFATLSVSKESVSSYISDAKTPISSMESTIQWQRRLATSTGTAYNSTPILTESSIYIVCEDILYQLDKGGNIISTLPLASSMNSACHPHLEKNKLFIPLSGGIMQCVDITTQSSLWVSEGLENQSLTTTHYQNGFVYAGTSHPNGKSGTFYCLDADTGSTIWTYENADSPCGFYWSGAAFFETHTSSAILFGGDNGILVSHSLTDDTVLDTYDLSSLCGKDTKIRAGITYDSFNHCYYTTTLNGYLCQIQMNEDGSFDTITTVFLGDTKNDMVNCTSTPTICNGRIYVGSYCGTQGRLSVIDANNMKILYHVIDNISGEVKSSPLISTGYANDDNPDTVYIYFTQNCIPGGLYCIKDSASTTSATVETLITPPKEGQQFCMSPIVADHDGTLYYSNDSGYLFAVGKGTPPTSTPLATKEPATSSQSPSLSTPVIPPQNTTNVSATKPKESKKVVGKPTKITYKIKKRKRKYHITLRWKKGKLAKGTCIQVKGRKKYVTKGNKATFLLKKGTYTFRFTSYSANHTKSKTVKRKIKVR